MLTLGFPNGSAVKRIACSAWDAGDAGSFPGLGRSPGGRYGNPLQYSCQENPMDRGVWQETVHWVAQSRTRLKRLSTHVESRKEQSIYRCTAQLLPWMLEGMVVPLRWGILEENQVLTWFLRGRDGYEVPVAMPVHVASGQVHVWV